MILHYLNKKTNIQQDISQQIYKKIIKQLKRFAKDGNLNLKKEFNTSFEFTTLHLFIVFYSYQNKHEINQKIMNLFINDLDFSLRQKGIGDMSIGKYVKKYTKKFYYRLKKLDIIFKTGNFDDFLFYIKKTDILNNNQNNENFYKFIYDYIIQNINAAKTKEIANFSFQNLE